MGQAIANSVDKNDMVLVPVYPTEEDELDNLMQNMNIFQDK